MGNLSNRIAVIDTGFNDNYIGRNKISGYTLKVRKGKMFKTPDYIDKIGHGTAVVCILDRIVDNTEIAAIRFDYNYCRKYGFDKWLCLALEYILCNEKFDVINISFGFYHCFDVKRLKDICGKLKEKGTVITAAFDNNGAYSYPSMLENVIGVCCSDNISKKQYAFDELNLNILKPVKKWKLPRTCGDYSNVSGNSFVTPEVAGHIYNLMQSGVSSSEIHSVLKKNADSVFSCEALISDISENKLEISKAITYPFNKEIRVIARNEETLMYQITGYYDEPVLGNVGKSIGGLLNCKNDKKILSSKCIDWDADFDTVILGHSELLSNLLGFDIKAYFVKMCLDYKKNLYLFDEGEFINGESFKNIEENFYSVGNWIKKPQKNINIDFSNEMECMLFNINCPVLCVAGTSSEQGKFTIQLALRNCLKKKYNVCNFATEPSGELLGCEGMYTFGYNAVMPYEGWKNIIAVNHELHKLELRSPDIIITGLQSRTIVPEAAGFKSYPIKQQEFLMGCACDTYILCFNKSDSVRYIRRTIKYLESIFPSKVLCLCLNDVSAKANKLTKVLIFVRNYLAFRKRTYYLSDKVSLERMGELAVKYYAA